MYNNYIGLEHVKEMSVEKNDLMIELIVLQNLIIEEKNYLEILKGYCESALDRSDDYNKIYPLLEMIYELQEKVSNLVDKLASDF